MWDTKGRHPGAVTFKHLKDLKRGESKIYPLVSNESSFLCSLSIKVRSHYLPVFSNLFLKCFYILKCKTTSFPVKCIILQVYTSFLTASKYSNRQRNELKSIQLVCLPNFSPFFLISVLIINTDKMCDYITLFILILSFKTGSLCWTFMTFEEGLSSHQISKWLWRSVSGLVASRLSKHLLIWISAHLLDNEFCV